MMMIRTKDLGAQEILLERWEAIESGKLKGRRRLLFVAADHDEVVAETDQVLSFCYSQQDGSKGEHHHCAPHSSSSSSSSWPNCVDKAQEVKKSVLEAVEEERRFVIASRLNKVLCCFLRRVCCCFPCNFNIMLYELLSGFKVWWICSSL